MVIQFLKESTPRSEAIRCCPKGRWKFTFTIEVSRNSENGTSRRKEVFSSGKISTIIRTLFAKWLWDELSSEEFELFVSLPQVFTPVIGASFIARSQGIPKKEIRRKLLELKELGLIDVPDHQQYKSLIGQCFLVIRGFQVSLRKTRKYSGYARHHNDKGSLSPSLREFLPSELESPPNFITEEFIVEFLTSVYGLPLFLGKAVLTMEPKKVRNGELNHLR
jgi:hypothetical protein